MIGFLSYHLFFSQEVPERNVEIKFLLQRARLLRMCPISHHAVRHFKIPFPVNMVYLLVKKRVSKRAVQKIVAKNRTC